jgi:hypothetical protein
MNGKTLLLLILTLAFFWLAPLNLQAADGAKPLVNGADRTSIEALRHEVEMLKQTVRRLEEVISEMEKHPAHPNVPREAATKAPVDQTGAAASPAMKEATEPSSAAAAETSTLHDSAGGSPAVNSPVPNAPAEPPSAAAATASAPADTGRDAPSIPQQWRSIERRMSPEQIEALLGAPQQKFSVAGKTVWYYQYPNNKRGSVTFSEDMQVSGWQKPPFGAF